MFGMLFDTGFGTRCLVGMRHIADVILRVAGLVVRMLLVCWGARGSFCVRSLVRGRRGFGFADRLNRVRCMDFAAFVVGMRAFVVRIMIVFVRWLLITRLVMVVGSAEVRLGIAMLGGLVFMEIVGRLFVGIFRLTGDLRLEARILDDLALDALAIAAPARAAMARTTPIGPIFIFFLGLAMSAFVGFDQRLTVGDRDLIIVRMNFAEGKKAMAVAAVFDKGRLKRRLHARNLGEIDVAAKLFALSGLEIKLFDAIAADHDDPGLLRMGGIDKHFVGHFVTLGGGGRV